MTGKASVDQPQPVNIGSSMARGAGWMVLARLAAKSLSFVSTLVLARLLTPDDFGLVATGILLYGALDEILMFSIEAAIIKERNADRSHYDTGFTLDLMRGFLIGAILAFAAGPIAVFFGDPRVKLIVLTMVPIAILNGFTNIGTVDFRKNMQMHREFQLHFVPRLAAFLVTLALAWVYRSYWALVMGMFVQSLASVLLSYAMHPLRPRLSLRKTREIFHFSFWMWLTNVLLLVRTRADAFVVSKFAGIEAFGEYSLARQIAEITSTELLAPIQRALFPAYALVSDDMAALRGAYIKTVGATMLVVAPITLGIALTAEFSIPLLLGPKWLAIIPLVQILAAAGLIHVISANVSPIFFALGRPGLISWVTIFNIAVLLPLLLLLVPLYGIKGGAIALAITAGLSTVVYLFLVKHILKFRFVDLVKAVARTIAGSSLMCLAVILVNHAWTSNGPVESAILPLLSAIVVGAVVYTASIVSFWRLWGDEDTAETWIFNKIRSRLPGYVGGLG